MTTSRDARQCVGFSGLESKGQASRIGRSTSSGEGSKTCAEDGEEMPEVKSIASACLFRFRGTGCPPSTSLVLGIAAARPSVRTLLPSAQSASTCLPARLPSQSVINPRRPTASSSDSYSSPSLTAPSANHSAHTALRPPNEAHELDSDPLPRFGTPHTPTPH
nr:hypothetical protein CFP56_09866 [Quercus suber]